MRLPAIVLLIMTTPPFAAHGATLQYKIKSTSGTSMPGIASSPDTSSKITSYYIKDGREAKLEPDGSGHIIDYKTGKFILLHGREKTYETTTLENHVQKSIQMNKEMSKASGISEKQALAHLKNMNIKITYNKKGESQVLGKSCNVYNVQTRSKQMNQTSKECWLTPAPAAMNEKRRYIEKQFAKLGQKITFDSRGVQILDKITAAPPEIAGGFLMSSDTNTQANMSGMSLPKDMAGKFKLPSMANKEVVVSMSENPFSNDVFNIPKGYKPETKNDN